MQQMIVLRMCISLISGKFENLFLYLFPIGNTSVFLLLNFQHSQIILLNEMG